MRCAHRRQLCSCKCVSSIHGFDDCRSTAFRCRHICIGFRDQRVYLFVCAQGMRVMADDHFIKRDAGEPPGMVEFFFRPSVQQPSSSVVVALHNR